MNNPQKTIPHIGFHLLGTHPDLIHFITTREGGFSEGSFSSLNLSFRTGDDPDKVERNRTLIAGSFNIDRAKLIFPTQTHQDKVFMICPDFLVKSEEEQNSDLNGVDALITNLKEVCLCILTADCASIMLFDPVRNAIGIAHAGWRGTVSQIALKTVESMKLHFGSNARDMFAGIGPCISLDAFEVGGEVANAFGEVFHGTEGIVVRKPEWIKPHIDIKKANCMVLNRAGIPENQIEISEECTFNNSERFFSARKNSGGRFAAGIMLKKN